MKSGGQVDSKRGRMVQVKVLVSPVRGSERWMFNAITPDSVKPLSISLKHHTSWLVQKWKDKIILQNALWSHFGQSAHSIRLPPVSSVFCSWPWLCPSAFSSLDSGPSPPVSTFGSLLCASFLHPATILIERMIWYWEQCQKRRQNGQKNKEQPLQGCSVPPKFHLPSNFWQIPIAKSSFLIRIYF